MVAIFRASLYVVNHRACNRESMQYEGCGCYALNVVFFCVGYYKLVGLFTIIYITVLAYVV